MNSLVCNLLLIHILSWLFLQQLHILARNETRVIPCLAEGVGFEPTFAKGENGFQDRHHKPLGHPSELKAKGETASSPKCQAHSGDKKIHSLPIMSFCSIVKLQADLAQPHNIIAASQTNFHVTPTTLRYHRQ